MVLAAAGHVEHERVVELAEQHFGAWQGGAVGHEFREPAVVPRVEVKTRDTEQAHLVFGGEALTRGDERRFAFGLLNHILGAGMSSRLFREIREERGLAYAVYSFRMPYADSGAYGIYVGTTPRQSAQVLELIRAGLAGLAEDGVTADELERAKGNMKGSLALSMEETNSRMIRLGRHELTGVRHLSLDETVAAIEGVTCDEVHEVAQEVFSSPRVLGAVGPFGVSDLEAFVR